MKRKLNILWLLRENYLSPKSTQNTVHADISGCRIMGFLCSVFSHCNTYSVIHDSGQVRSVKGSENT